MLVSTFVFAGLSPGHAPNADETRLPRERRETVAPKPVEVKSGARFVYDRELNRTFVEFIDPNTGKAIARFPSKAPLQPTIESVKNKDLVTAEPGTLVDTIA